ncbi:EAL domain-containing protein (putative c-di-GMP-specific phosphodiesterase class I) [Gulbenkiania mobilis]|uniref:EAL domain-containing protein (Putative c-di-GMP-specific phosphodiesterase class I) n=3 Tax=Chromobacteriaceae TaxID=1499392 RepID=A0ABY2CXW6_GULMO|nr:EAL domain-containing protein (putative c-di-GMP-specific phosphodiesterase class I) [Gulbenkiania mobilis]
MSVFPPTSTAKSAMPLDEIWQALVNDQLVPFFQPIVNLADRKVLGAEALARWHHPALGVLSPVTFVPVMEERGMMRELTELILEKSLYACRDWLDSGYDLFVSINLSGLSLADQQLPAYIAQKARIAGLPPANLMVELSENTLRQHWDTAAPQLMALRAQGFGVAVDDFGVGFGLEQKIDNRCFSALKMDRAFVHGAASNSHLLSILSESVALGEKHGLTTVAIGVEDAADLAVLTEIRCTAVQGYICSPPLPAQGLIPWISAWENG